MPCFEIEDSELTLAAFTILPVEAVNVAEEDGDGSWERTVGKSVNPVGRGWLYVKTHSWFLSIFFKFPNMGHSILADGHVGIQQ